MEHIRARRWPKAYEKNDLHYRAQVLRSPLYRQPQLAGGLISVDGSSKAVPDGEPRARNSCGWLTGGAVARRGTLTELLYHPYSILYSSSAFASEASETSFRSLIACVFWSGRQER